MIFQNDPESGRNTSSSDPDLPQDRQDSTPQTNRFKPGVTILFYSVLTLLAFAMRLHDFFTLVPSQMGWFSFLRVPFFCFSVDFYTLVFDLLLLLIFSKSFEKSLGSLGFFIRLGVHKAELAAMAKGFYEFLIFIGMDSVWDSRLTLSGFWPLFAVVFSEFIFYRSNETLTFGFTQMKIPYVRLFIVYFRIILHNKIKILQSIVNF